MTRQNFKKRMLKIRHYQSQLAFLTGNRDYIGDLANEFDIYVGNKDDQSESLNHSGMLALVDKEGNVRCRFGKDGMPILYYSGLNYDDQEGKNASLKRQIPARQKIIDRRYSETSRRIKNGEKFSHRFHLFLISMVSLLF